jgi:hypothetical protein
LQRVIHNGVRALFAVGVCLWVWIQTGSVNNTGPGWKDLTTIAIAAVPVLMGIVYRDIVKRLDRHAEKLDLVEEKFEDTNSRLVRIETSCKDRTCFLQPQREPRITPEEEE